MTFKNPGSIIEKLESPLELRRIRAGVDPRLEITGIADRSAPCANFGGEMGIDATRKTRRREWAASGRRRSAWPMT
jgi:3-polyprenyl-4-hydroxybenzoate decarboxylase